MVQVLRRYVVTCAVSGDLSHAALSSFWLKIISSPGFDAACDAAQATQAYLEGDKALAKKLGASGRWHGAQMAKAHQLASEDIFRQRNPSPQGTFPTRGAHTLPCLSIPSMANISA